MKEIFDWLREAICEGSQCINERYYTTVVHSLSCVNEAEAKWESDCCEYEYDNVSNLCRSSCNGWLLEGADAWHFNFCPYCGKPIKISEVE